MIILTKEHILDIIRKNNTAQTCPSKINKKACGNKLTMQITPSLKIFGFCSKCGASFEFKQAEDNE